jgi:polyisoprenoid-binding protein YceI
MTTTKWILDPTHSELGFKIKHLMITNVSGAFKNFQAEAKTTGEDFSTAKISLTADMASISTNNEQRDAHLRNSEFNSTRIEQADSESFVLHGELTLKGVTKPVKLNVEYSSVTRDPWGGERVGFVITGKIRRSDWGINFNSVLETGGVALGEEVKIAAEVQMVKQPESVPA